RPPAAGADVPRCADWKARNMSTWRRVTDVFCFVWWVAPHGPRSRRAAALSSGPDIRPILVLTETSGLGNLVQLSGLLLNLRRLYPAARITVAMPASSVATALVTKELADEVVFFASRAGHRGELLGFAWRVLRERGFDLGLATFFSPTLLTSVVLRVARCRYRVAYAENEQRGFLNTITLFDRGGRELERHVRLLEYTGCPLERKTTVSISPDGSDRAIEALWRRGLGVERPLLGIHPGCDRVNALKRWPIERVVSVITRFVTDNLAGVLVFLGPDERDLGTALADLEHRVGIFQSDRLEETAALIARCDAFLSNDSGLMHVAAALGVPVVAIFGPTSTEKNAPVGDVTLLTATGVPCRPCYTGSPIRCLHERRYCLEGIGVDEVADAVEQYLLPKRVALWQTC